MPRDIERFPVAVGDPVKVSSSGFDRQRGPYDGTVTKVGRTLITIDVPEGSHLVGRQAVFRLTGGINDRRFGDWGFQTIPEFELAQRRERALEVLCAYNLGPIRGSQIPIITEVLECMAALLIDPEEAH